MSLGHQGKEQETGPRLKQGPGHAVVRGAKVVTRIAPSPTGILHIGTARTALFNYLFARRHGGEFTLRVEDTDKQRNTPEALASITDGLSWLGILWDGPIVYQSRNISQHVLYAQKLLSSGMAYRSYLTEDELEARRAANSAPGGVGYVHRFEPGEDTPKAGVLPVVRLKVPVGKFVVIKDAVQGEVSVSTDTISDFIILRGDGSPVYTFAVVCDDADCGVTHVIRGDDHLTNTAKHILLFEALGFDLPVFAHVPLIYGPDGGKLSKRHGAVGIAEYQAMGYLSEAIVSYIARLGWSTDVDDVLNLEELCSRFDLAGVSKSPARFDFDKLNSVNSFYLSKMEALELGGLLGLSPLSEKDIAAIDAMKGRANTLVELSKYVEVFGRNPTQFAPEVVEALKREGHEGGALALALEFFSAFAAGDGARAEQASGFKDLQAALKSFLQQKGVKMKDFAPCLRACLIGELSMLGIGQIVEVLGVEESLRRIKACCELYG